MFHFPAFPPHALYIQARVTRHDSGRVPPFGNPRITVRLPTPRGLSQATTSFFGSWCQGIHRTLLKTYTTNHTKIRRCSRPLYSSQTTNQDTHPHHRAGEATSHEKTTTPTRPTTQHTPRSHRGQRPPSPQAHATSRPGSPVSSGPNSVPTHDVPPMSKAAPVPP